MSETEKAILWLALATVPGATNEMLRAKFPDLWEAFNSIWMRRFP